MGIDAYILKSTREKAKCNVVTLIEQLEFKWPDSRVCIVWWRVVGKLKLFHPKTSRYCVNNRTRNLVLQRHICKGINWTNLVRIILPLLEKSKCKEGCSYKTPLVSLQCTVSHCANVGIKWIKIKSMYLAFEFIKTCLDYHNLVFEMLDICNESWTIKMLGLQKKSAYLKLAGEKTPTQSP